MSTPDLNTGGETPAAAPGATPSAAQEPESRTVLSIIRDLQAGRLAGSALPTADRRRVVEQLTMEGYTVAEIAEILKTSDRTIARDKAAVKAANALSPSPELITESAGMLIRQAEAAVGRLRRMAREKDFPAAVRVQAEVEAFAITKSTIGILQSIGYIPTAATRIEATLDARLRSEHAPSYEDLQKEIERLEAILGPDAAASQEFQSLAVLKDTVSRLSVGQQLRALSLPARDLIEESREAPAVADPASRSSVAAPASSTSPGTS